MESVPCLNKPRYSTLTIALPGSVISNCQTKELQTYLAGQIARTATLYHVDEIVVFDDHLVTRNRGFYNNNNKHRHHKSKDKNPTNDTPNADDNKKDDTPDRQPFNPHTFMARILQYCECPQYLRKYFFPLHADLQFSGLLPPLDAPHHVRADDLDAKYREGVVLDKTGPNGHSLVQCGLYKPVEIDRVLQSGLRCTVKLKPPPGPAKPFTGTVVSPAAPRHDNGTYWGYTMRLASGLQQVFDECPYGTYDLKIGTSERGNSNVNDAKFALPPYQHAVIVFGGVAGIEECIDADEQCKVSGSNAQKLFDLWVNTCPLQGSRTVRTEEAILISLARLSPYFQSNPEPSSDSKDDKTSNTPLVEPVKFFDKNELSDESENNNGE
jgi:predicted SPOUT superfamily RNA methylase MTH1